MKGTTEDEMIGWHHQLYGHEFEQTMGDGEGQVKTGLAAVHGITKSETLTTEQKQSSTYIYTVLLQMSGRKGPTKENTAHVLQMYYNCLWICCKCARHQEPIWMVCWAVIQWKWEWFKKVS